MSLLSIGLDDEMGVEVKLPDKQMAIVKTMVGGTTTGIYALAGSLTVIGLALGWMAYKKGR